MLITETPDASFLSLVIVYKSNVLFLIFLEIICNFTKKISTLENETIF